MPESTGNCVVLEALRIGYNRRSQLMDPIDAQAHGGQLIALLGRNGAGKSTLLRTLMGNVRPLGGTISINGVRTSGLARRAKARMIAYAPSRFEADGSMLLREVVGLARFPHRGWFAPGNERDARAVDWALEMAGISRLAQRPVAHLSDGERQRAGLALVLAQETPIILLDEPTAFLDVTGKRELVDLLAGLASSTGRAIIYSTHDLEAALEYASGLWIMDGRTLRCRDPRTAAADGSLATAFNTPSVRWNGERFVKVTARR